MIPKERRRNSCLSVRVVHLMLNAKRVVTAAKDWWRLHPESLELPSGNLIPGSGVTWNLFSVCIYLFTLRVPVAYVVVSLQRPSQSAFTGSSELL